jgi:serine/threonine protein kinase
MADSRDDGAFQRSPEPGPNAPTGVLARGRWGAGSRLLGRFTIEQKLGQGGAGRVFVAFDEAHRKRVALKTLIRPSRGSLAQLEREFRIASSLGHPNLVRLHEFFSEGGDCFFTMELVQGKTLEEFLRRGPDEQKLERIFLDLARAVAALHHAGILHGDLKPSNLLISEGSERVVLLDFGHARLVGDVALDVAGGTPLYMSPEQLAGAELTEASDWYSFGVVLFYALTGRLPKRETVEYELAGAPERLAALCVELLRPARDARPSGDTVIERLGGSAVESRA